MPIVALLFLFFLACAVFGGFMGIVAIGSDRPADKRFVFPSLVLAACGTIGAGVILLATR